MHFPVPRFLALHFDPAFSSSAFFGPAFSVDPQEDKTANINGKNLHLNGC